MTKNPSINRLSYQHLYELSLSLLDNQKNENPLDNFLSSLQKILNAIHASYWQVDEPLPILQFTAKDQKSISTSRFQKAIQLIFHELRIGNCKVITHQTFFLHITKVTEETLFVLIFTQADQVPSALETQLLFPNLKNTIQHLPSYTSLFQKDQLIVTTVNQLNEVNFVERHASVKSVLDNLADGLLIFSPTGNIIYTNERIRTQAEFEIEDLSGKPTIAQLPLSVENKKAVKRMLKKVCAEGKNYQFTVPSNKRKSGHLWWADGKISPFKTDDGKIEGAIVVVRDITSAKMVDGIKKELQQTQEQYNLIIDQGFDGVLTYDLLNHRLLDVNDAFLRNLGYQKQEYLNADFESLTPQHQPNEMTSAAYLAKVNQRIRKSKKGKINYNWVHKKKDGSLSYVEIIAVRLKAPNNHIKVEIHQDVTQRYLAVKELEENRERLNKYIDRSPIAVHIRSIDSHRFERVNQKFTELFGYNVDELNDKDRQQLVVNEDRTFIDKQMRRLLDGEIPSFRSEKQYIRKDGSFFWGAATRSLVYLKNETLLIGFIEDISEQKKAQQALEESEAKVRAIFNSTQDKIITLDPQLRIIYLNQSAEDLLNYLYKKKVAIGDEYLSLNENLSDEFAEAFQLALEGKSSSVQRAYNYQCQKRIDLISVLPNRNADNEVIGILLHGREITQLEKVKEALVESKRSLQKGEIIGKFGSWSIEIATGEVHWSKGMYHIYRRDPSKGPTSYKELISIIHPDDKEEIKRRIAEISLHKPFSPYNYRIYTPEKKLIYINLQVENIFEGGKLVRIIGTAQDVTDIKQAENLLVRSSQKYQDLFDNMYDALIILDKNGQFVNVNKATERMLEYSLRELQSKRFIDLVHPDDRGKSEHNFSKLKAEGFYSGFQVRIITRSGKVRHLQVNSNAIIENGAVTGSRDIARDITELKKAEEKREELYRELEEANTELNDFAYIVSHDLKAPLRAISSLSSWIAEDYADIIDDEGQQVLQLLLGRANRMQKFIEGILAYSRLGRVSAEIEAIDLNLFLNDILLDLNLPDEFLVHIPMNLPIIKGQKLRLQQVFQNLLQNAYKYNDKEAGWVSIQYADLGEYHQFIVKDNGKGIDEKHFHKIFQIFQTLQSRDQYESTGIGLTIVKKIIELHGGDINVASKQGEGSTFTFTIAKKLEIT